MLTRKLSSALPIRAVSRRRGSGRTTSSCPPAIASAARTSAPTSDSVRSTDHVPVSIDTSSAPAMIAPYPRKPINAVRARSAAAAAICAPISVSSCFIASIRAVVVAKNASPVTPPRSCVSGKRNAISRIRASSAAAGRSCSRVTVARSSSVAKAAKNCKAWSCCATIARIFSSTAVSKVPLRNAPAPSARSSPARSFAVMKAA
ncbi:hypothetical protein U716_00230 [Rhodobacter capsulatus B6]|nr:hypothetical protein U716_00230 [Rhodobacter capsulatus B6]